MSQWPADFNATRMGEVIVVRSPTIDQLFGGAAVAVSIPTVNGAPDVEGLLLRINAWPQVVAALTEAYHYLLSAVECECPDDEGDEDFDDLCASCLLLEAMEQAIWAAYDDRDGARELARQCAFSSVLGVACSGKLQRVAVYGESGDFRGHFTCCEAHIALRRKMGQIVRPLLPTDA